MALSGALLAGLVLISAALRAAPRPDDSIALLEAARAADERGETDKAIGLYRKVLASRPDDFVARMSLARDFVSAGKLEEARAQFAAAAGPSAEKEAYFESGYADEAAGNAHEAEQAFRRAIAAHPADPAAYHHLASFLFRERRYAEADRSMREALRLFDAARDRPPDNDYLHSQLWFITILQTEGKLSEAEAACRRALALARAGHPGWEAIFLGQLASVENARGRKAEAVALLQHAARMCGGGTCDRLQTATVLTTLAALEPGPPRAERERAARAAWAVWRERQSREWRTDRCDFQADAGSLDRLGKVFEDLGDGARALEVYRSVLSLRSRLRSSPEIAQAEAGQARVGERGGR